MTLPVPVERHYYNKALKALETAHKACYNHPDRDLLGMSNGPFSGVNEALGIIALLEEVANSHYKRIQSLEKQMKQKRVFNVSVSGHRKKVVKINV